MSTSAPEKNQDTSLQYEQLLRDIYDALQEKGYQPVPQIVGYLLTEDPTYITNHNRARARISCVDRDELMREIVQAYFDQKATCHSADATEESY